MSVYFYLIVSIALTVASQVTQKYLATSSVSVPAKNKISFYCTSPLFWASLIFLGFSMLSWLFVLDKMDVGKAYAMLSANYVIMLIASKLLFHEAVPLSRWGGACLIVLGVYVVSLS